MLKLLDTFFGRGVESLLKDGIKMMMIYAMKHRNVAHSWSKVLLLVSFGKVFVAGAGLGLAALGIVDIAGSLGVRPVVDFIERERILDIFAFGGGALATIVQIAWKIFGR